MPVISVIVPVYNVEQYLNTCIDSLLMQSFSDIEILCIDDNSTDRSHKLMSEYAQKDPRVRVFRNETNLGPGPARNAGLENARGEYICFVDSDDHIDQDYLAELYEMAQKTGADIVMNSNVLTQTKGVTTEYVHSSKLEIPEGGCPIDNRTAVEETLCSVWARLYRRSFLEVKGIRFEGIPAEDMAYHYLVNLLASQIFVFRGKAAYYYLIREASAAGLISSNNKRDLSAIINYDRVFDYLSEHRLLESLKTKVFYVWGYYKVDTPEKYDCYRAFFQKVQGFLNDHKEQYNEMDRFFMNIILNTDSFDDYKSKYPASLSMAFLKSKRTK